MALILTLLLMLLLSTMAATLALTTSVDGAAADYDGAAVEALSAAEAGVERVLADLRSVGDLTPILDGSSPSAFTDGGGLTRVAPGGTPVRLDEVVNLATCARPQPCTEAQAAAVTPDRPWGSRNPRWRLFAHGSLDSLASAEWRGFSPYVVVLVADDPAETDGDPLRDGVQSGVAVNPGAGVLLVRAEAFGRRNAHRVIEATVRRADLAALARWRAADPLTRGPAPSGPPQVQRLAWTEVR